MLTTMRTLGAAGLLVLAALGAASAEGLPDLKGRTILFGTPADYSPYAFQDPAENNAIKGYDIDMVEEIAKRLNAKVEWKTVAWDITLQAVRDGQFEAAVDGITITDERRQVVDFSVPYTDVQTRMIVKAEENRFSDSAGFKAAEDATVVALPGTSQFYTAVYTFFDGQESHPRLKQFDTYNTALLALINGEVDMVLTDNVNAQKLVDSTGGKLKALDEVLGREEFGIAFTPKSDLVEPFNAAIAAMKADGTFAKLDQKWFAHE